MAISEEKEVEDNKKPGSRSRKCPNCHSDMEAGEISSKDPIIWKEDVDSQEGERIDKDTLSKFALKYDRIPSFKCDSCKLIVVEYDKKKPPTITW
jgi:hypothetical protein